MFSAYTLPDDLSIYLAQRLLTASQAIDFSFDDLDSQNRHKPDITVKVKVAS